MKPILEHFKSLPDEIRERAVANASVDTLHVLKETLSDAVEGAFIWDKTPEGHHYWESVSEGNYPDTIPTILQVPTSIPISDLLAFLNTNADKDGKISVDKIKKGLGI